LKDTIRLDPWGASDIRDYSKLFDLFGIEPLDKSRFKVFASNRYIRRNIDFGHRDLDKILRAVENNKPYAVMSGIKPTGPFHLGSKMTADEIVYFQRLSPKARAFYAIADVEAYCDNGLSFTESSKIAVNNLADILALGLDPDRAYVYKQSEAIQVMNMSFIFSKDVTYNMMKAIYGTKPFGLYISALIQAGDILLPQRKEFGGPKPVLVPVGADQDPHIRLARDLAKKHQSDFKFVMPSAIYHKLTRSLSGEYKMSKRDPMSLITLDDDLFVAKKKVMNCLTGGRESTELQRKLGGEPEKCVNYELCVIHFAEDDDFVKRVYRECMSGERICGNCKKEASELVVNFLKEHQKRKGQLIEKAKELLKKSKEELISSLK
jgi:tryptophanyl-tRNA synthetase